jgi:hypothetical protein
MQREWRRVILSRILDGGVESGYGLRIVASQDLECLADDPGGDQIDALLCAIQAAWAWTMKDQNYGAPPGAEPLLEGWIADPMKTPPVRSPERDARVGFLFGVNRRSVHVREGVDLTELVFDECPYPVSAGIKDTGGLGLHMDGYTELIADRMAGGAM